MLPTYLNLESIDAIIRIGLSEDVGPGDVTTLATIPSDRVAEGRFLAKEEGIIAGLLVVERVFASIDSNLNVTWNLKEGEYAASGNVFGTIKGPARSILTGERLALNLIQRLSGIATATRRMVDAVGQHHTRILDTRKTAPGLRLLDKWAVLLGGGQNHRIGLYDMILIKDNHITAAGGIRNAIEKAHRFLAHSGQELKIEVETRTLAEVDEVLEVGGVDLILLDNMVRMEADGSVNTSLLKIAVDRIGGRILTEASGNVTLQTVPAIAATGVDFISSGSLTHSVQALDISLKITLDRAHP